MLVRNVKPYGRIGLQWEHYWRLKWLLIAALGLSIGVRGQPACQPGGVWVEAPGPGPSDGVRVDHQLVITEDQRVIHIRGAAQGYAIDRIDSLLMSSARKIVYWDTVLTNSSFLRLDFVHLVGNDRLLIGGSGAYPDCATLLVYDYASDDIIWARHIPKAYLRACKAGSTEEEVVIVGTYTNGGIIRALRLLVDTQTGSIDDEQLGSNWGYSNGLWNILPSNQQGDYLQGYWRTEQFAPIGRQTVMRTGTAGWQVQLTFDTLDIIGGANVPLQELLLVENQLLVGLSAVLLNHIAIVELDPTDGSLLRQRKIVTDFVVPRLVNMVTDGTSVYLLIHEYGALFDPASAHMDIIKLSQEWEIQWAKRLRASVQGYLGGHRNVLRYSDNYLYLAADYAAATEGDTDYLVRLHPSDGSVVADSCALVNDAFAELGMVDLIHTDIAPLVWTDTILASFIYPPDRDTLYTVALIDGCRDYCPETCNGIDDDWDGLIDCCDPDLIGAPCCVEQPIVFDPAPASDTLLACTLPLTLGVDGAYQTYRWSDGSGGAELAVDAPGWYTLEVTDGPCRSYADSVYVTRALSSTRVDAKLCAGDSLTLSDGTLIDTPGNYEVLLTTTTGCDSLVELNVIGLPVPTISWSVDTLCVDGQPALRLVPVNTLSEYTFVWSDGSTETGRVLFEADTYAVTVTDAAGCGNTFTFDLQPPVPVVLTEIRNTVDCTEGRTLVVAAAGGEPPYAYTWADGTTGDTFRPAVDLVSDIVVTATDARGCTAALALRPVKETGAPAADFPNVLLPGTVDDGRFFAVDRATGGSFTGLVSLRVYNRWGQLLYAGNGPGASWDGTHRGQAVPQGVYVYRAVLRCAHIGEVAVQGDVTVLR